MLQDLRKSTKGTTAKIVVGVIVVSFALFGIESILVGGGGGGVAEVNGEKIQPDELQQLVNTQRRRLIEMMGENLDPSLLDDQSLTARALDSIIARKLQLQAAGSLDMAVSEQQIGAVVATMEQFQIDGQFSPELYKNVLSSAGYTPGSFKKGLRDDLLVNQLTSGLVGSEFVTPAETELNARFLAESRDVRYLTIPVVGLSEQQDVGDGEVEAYYQQHQQIFLSPESVELDYIKLAIDDFRRPVSEEVLLEKYELEKANYQYQSERGVSHILFVQGKDESDQVFSQRIKLVQDQVQSGAEFSDLAKEYSDDVGSAGFGGELGFTRGDTFPAEMEEAISALEAGAVSAPVTTEAGVHLVKLTELREAEMPSLEEIRDELVDRVQRQEAKSELTLVVEKLKDIAFNAEDLNAPAQELSLEIERSEPVTRMTTSELFSRPMVLSTAFSEEVLDQGHNSDVIDLGNDTYLTLRVHKYNEASVKALDDVRQDIVALIASEAAQQALLETADTSLVAVRNGTSIEQLAQDNSYEWQVELAVRRDNILMSPPLLQRVFELPVPPAEGAVYDYVLLPSGDAQLFEVSRVTPGNSAQITPPQKSQMQQQITAEFAEILSSEFQKGLKDRAEITVM